MSLTNDECETSDWFDNTGGSSGYDRGSKIRIITHPKNTVPINTLHDTDTVGERDRREEREEREDKAVLSDEADSLHRIYSVAFARGARQIGHTGFVIHHS